MLRPNPCNVCSGLHFKSKCSFRNVKCFKCDMIGHKNPAVTQNLTDGSKENTSRKQVIGDKKNTND